jgi:hypothetical protein
VLAWNQRKVRQLTPNEIWLFIAGRALTAFGIGVVAMRQFPGVVGRLGWPAVIVGFVLLLVAGKGMMRPAARDDSRPAV